MTIATAIAVTPIAGLMRPARPTTRTSFDRQSPTDRSYREHCRKRGGAYVI